MTPTVLAPRALVRALSVAAAIVISAATAAAQPVSVTGANPPIGEQDTVGLIVRVTGRNFAPGARADFFKSKTSDPAGVTVRETRFVSATELDAVVDIAPTAELSYFDVRVTNLSGRSGKGSDLFQVIQKGAGRPATSVSATATFRCYADTGTVPPDPCATPMDGSDNTVDRARDDQEGAYYGGVIDISLGVFQIHLSPADVPARELTLLLGAFAAPRTCESVGNCNPDGPLDNRGLVLAESDIRVKPLVDSTLEDLPGGLFAMSCGVGYPGLVHYTFWLPSRNGHWGLNFNPRAYAPSTGVTLRRLDNLTWTAEANGTDHLAELISFAHTGIRRKNGPSREGFFRVPFKLTLVAATMPAGAVTCSP